MPCTSPCGKSLSSLSSTCSCTVLNFGMSWYDLEICSGWRDEMLVGLFGTGRLGSCPIVDWRSFDGEDSLFCCRILFDGDEWPAFPLPFWFIPDELVGFRKVGCRRTLEKALKRSRAPWAAEALDDEVAAARRVEVLCNCWTAAADVRTPKYLLSRILC